MGLMRTIQGRRGVLRGLGGTFLATAVPTAGATVAHSSERQQVDTIILAERIYTMDARDTVVDAVAIRGGRILRTGKRSDILGLKGRRTRVVDLGDYTVLPGFVDPHMHSNFAGLRPWLDVGPFSTPTMDDARTKIRNAAAMAGQGVWVQAKMLDPSIMPGRPFSRQDLDQLSPNVPVFILESNGHNAYANSRAIELAGLTKDTPDPPQGRFERGPDGSLTGRLEEPPAFQPFIQVMTAPSASELVEYLRADLNDAAAKGCTALHDCGVGGLFAEADISLIEAALQDTPPVRYAGMLVSTHYEKWKQMGLRPGLHSPNFSFSGIKAWSDGSNQGLTGYQRKPYLNSSNRGALNYSPEEIETLVRTLHADGWPIGIHANGDAAIDVVLDAFERGTGGEGGHKYRHRIEHCSILHDDQIRRMKALGISPSFLIGHVHYWGRAFRDRLLGPERANRLDPCRSALAGGLRISLHSDYNVTPIDPLRCIENAVLRDMNEGGGILNPAECISPLEAIRAVTIDAAWQCHLDDVCGSLEVGKSADLVVLERDPTTVSPDTLRSIRIHSTWLGGQEVTR
ncbi:amidohydrolase [Phenylobacterium sp.]|jgi:predicted amidohydrolase YtcJ|uniref:amidohydrolase n=1 Tax=Phenylobacterium sp. TaxID=1871053 RepID=UPI0037C624D2